MNNGAMNITSTIIPLLLTQTILSPIMSICDPSLQPKIIKCDESLLFAGKSKHFDQSVDKSNLFDQSIVTSLLSQPQDITKLILSFLEPVNKQNNCQACCQNQKDKMNKLIDMDSVLDKLYDIYNSINPFISDDIELYPKNNGDSDGDGNDDINKLFETIMGFNNDEKTKLFQKLCNAIKLSTTVSCVDTVVSKMILSFVKIIIVKNMTKFKYLKNELRDPIEWETFPKTTIEKKMDELIDQSNNGNKDMILLKLFHFFEDKLMTPHKIYNCSTTKLTIPGSIELLIKEVLEDNDHFEEYFIKLRQIFLVFVSGMHKNHFELIDKCILNIKNNLSELLFLTLWETEIRGENITKFGHQSEIIMGIVSTVNNKYLDLILKTIKKIHESDKPNYEMIVYKPYFNVCGYNFCKYNVWNDSKSIHWTKGQILIH